MREAERPVERCLDARLDETACVGLSAVAQHVVLGREDVSRREAGKVGCQERRRVRARAVARVGEVRLGERVHVDTIEAVAVAEEVNRGMAVGSVAEVGDRNLEQLQREVRAVPVACHQGDGRGEVAAGGLAADGDPRRVDRQRVRVLRDPAGALRSSPPAAVGKGCSGARRYSTVTTAQRAPRQMWAHFASLTSESIVPNTKPPPWK